jgi:hypothetical protein
VRRRALVPWAIVVVAAVAYPLATLAGRVTRLPSPAECVHRATADGDLEVVFGRFEKSSDAEQLLQRVLEVGFPGSQIEPDGCGLSKVAVHGIPTLKVGAEVIGEARTVGVGATLEVVTR